MLLRLTQPALGVPAEALVPLMVRTIENDFELTGPISRGDWAVVEAHKAGAKVGLCGQAPSDHADFAEMLVEAGIDSISLNPDSVLDVLGRVAALESTLAPG